MLETEGETTREDAVEVIREGFRNLVSTERKQLRAAALNKNRVALGEIPEDTSFTAEFVVEKAKALKRKAIRVEEYRRLQNALIQSEENVNAFLSVNKILFALVGDLSGNDPALQLCAASCCCNIGLGNAKACAALAKSVAPYLIAELESLNRPLLETCAWTVGNLVSGCDKAFDILHAQDCFKYIITLIRDCDDDILPSITYAAMHYVRAGFQRITTEEMVELAQCASQRNFSYDDPHFVWLLALLSSIAACNTYLLRVVPSVVDYLYQSSINNLDSVSEVTASVRILANTVCESTGQVARNFVQNPTYTLEDLGVLLNKLLLHQHLHIRKEALWLLGNLYNHHAPDIQPTIKEVLPRLSGFKQAVLSLEQRAA